MESLLKALANEGVNASAMDEEQIRKVAKAVGIDPADHLPRAVKIVDHTNKRGETSKFVTTDPFIVGRKEDGTAQTVRGLFLRVAALPQALQDLQNATKLCNNEEE